MMVSKPNGSCDSWNIIKFWRQWHSCISSGHCPCHTMDSLGHVGPHISQHSCTFPETTEWLMERKVWFSCVSIFHLNWFATSVFSCCGTNHHVFISLNKSVYYLIVPQARSLSGLNWVLCSGSPKAETKMYARMGWKLWGRICFQVGSCLGNPDSCNCRTKVQVAGCWLGFTLSSQRPFPGPCPKPSLSLMGNLPHVEFLSCLESLPFTSVKRQRQCFVLKEIKFLGYALLEKSPFNVTKSADE